MKKKKLVYKFQPPCSLYCFDKCRVFFVSFTRSQDRRRVYAILDSEGIEIPRYAVLDRDSADPKRKFVFLLS